MTKRIIRSVLCFVLLFALSGSLPLFADCLPGEECPTPPSSGGAEGGGAPVREPERGAAEASPEESLTPPPSSPSEDAAIERMIPPLVDHAVVLNREISGLQRQLQDREREVQNHKQEARKARDSRKRNAYLFAARKAEEEAQSLRDQITRKESERRAKIEEMRRLGSLAYSNVADAIHLNDISRDEAMGNAMRRLDPIKVRAVPGAQIPEELHLLSRKFADDEFMMRAILKDAQVVEALSKMDMKDLGRNTRLFSDLDKSIETSAVSRETKEKIRFLRNAAAGAKENPHWRPNIETLFMETMRAAGQSLQHNRQGLENRFREVSRDINDLERQRKKPGDEAQIRQIDNDLSVLRRRQENLQYALLAGTQNVQPPMDTKELMVREQKEREIMLEQKRLRAAGREEEEIHRVADAMRAQSLPKEDKGICATAWDVTKGIAGGTWSGIKTVGGAIGTGAKWVGGGLLEAGSFFSQHGTPVKQALFSTFSALAQYRYTKKGSQNSDTQVYRGLAIALGLDMGFKGEMPRGMMDVVDPLTPFKRPVLSSQQVIAGQDEILRNVLNIGGNPASAGGFPYGAQDQLQAILESTRPGAPGSFVPGSRFPASASGAFPGIFDPSYRNFTGQAYNGFPPFPSTPTQGAILNPNFGAGNPFVMGSGLAAIASQTASANQGKQNLGNLVAATAAERGGIQNFRQQLERINPPGNSLKDLIDGVARVDTKGRALTARGQNVNQLIGQGNAAVANSLMLEQYNQYNTELRKLSEFNHSLFEAAREFRRFDFEIQRDADGLMAGSPRDWSKNMEARNNALLRLLDLTQKRNESMTNLAYIAYNPQLYQRILRQTPTVPISTPPKVSLLMPFLIRPLWADVPQNAFAFVPGWQFILGEEKKLVEKEMAQLRRERSQLILQLEHLVSLDPDGVHEINVPVLQVEELNMKAIALQTRQNLEKLKKAEDTVNVSIKMTPQEKAEAAQQIKDYRFLLSQLEEEAKHCANELAKVERLQLEKRTEFEIFHHFKPKGERLLSKM